MLAIGPPVEAAIIESVPEHRQIPVHRVDRRPVLIRRREDARGQSLVEFALVLIPLFVILLGIIQFGFIFNTYVTMTNAAREGARTGTIYVYNRACTPAQNDMLRNEAIRSALLSSMNLLGKTAPQFSTTAASGSTCSLSGGWTAPVQTTVNGAVVMTSTNGDLTVSYTQVGSSTPDTRSGQQVTVHANYHEDLIVPLISSFLPKDAGGRMVLTGEVTMVIN